MRQAPARFVPFLGLILSTRSRESQVNWFHIFFSYVPPPRLGFLHLSYSGGKIEIQFFFKDHPELTYERLAIY